MKTMLVATVLMFLTATTATAGNFGAVGSNAPHDKARAEASEKAFNEAVMKGAKEKQAELAAERAGDVAAAKSRTDERNGNLGVWISNQ